MEATTTFLKYATIETKTKVVQRHTSDETSVSFKRTLLEILTFNKQQREQKEIMTEITGEIASSTQPITSDETQKGTITINDNESTGARASARIRREKVDNLSIRREKIDDLMDWILDNDGDDYPKYTHSRRRQNIANTTCQSPPQQQYAEDTQHHDDKFPDRCTHCGHTHTHLVQELPVHQQNCLPCCLLSC